MTDRFKFRVWNKNTKKMYYGRECYINTDTGKPCFIYEDHGGMFSSGLIIDPIKDYDLMQCIGLKDKNGKLIYEGDIIQFTDGYPNNKINRVVEFKINKFINCLSYDSGGATTMYPYCVGNIHENSELLHA